MASASASPSPEPLVVQPKVLLLDEPLGALDLKLREQMQVELKQIQRDVGITFIFVTHDQEEALTLSDRIAVFNDGQIEQIGTPTDLYEARRRVRRGFVGTSNLFDASGRQPSSDATGTTLRPEKITRHSQPTASTGASVPGTVIEAITSAAASISSWTSTTAARVTDPRAQ